MQDAQALIVAAEVTKDEGQDSESTHGLVAAPVTLSNANELAAAGEQFIAQSPTTIVRLDLKNVEATSVAVGVALAWLAAAQKESKKLCFSNLSSDFIRVIEFSDIASMFVEHTSSS